ncbi:phosphoribosyltransferase [Lentzea sp. BCCO 10_0061]|uniref:Phosphoribosyltransferase n=1 Tax=Lentzea sokolovensis TaxID=3095429 RepID=A0ABU4VDL5_9PSEU|nr:phosphoribosyltransferase [Lentzea sp. BCCO 10_0061]MDX8149893.1 phosphoribosyltransferase [Lentzea sp. BCCO 10_0061]
MSNVEVVAAVVGSCGTLGALAWAMLGNPSLPSWLKRRRLPASPSRKPEKREIIEIKWKEIEVAVSNFVADNANKYDLVVGVHPDGISLANLMASKLSARYAAIEKRYTQATRQPFFVFDKESHARSNRKSITHFSAPPDINVSPRILIVDGVTTFGNALNKAEHAVRKEVKDAQIDFYVFAIDQPRLSASQPEVMKRVTFHRVIDNFAVWLLFPWDSR